MIHVCYGFRDNTGHYSKFAGTSMLSLLENTQEEVTVHILHDNTLTDDNREKFSAIAARYNQAVNFYNVDELLPKRIAKIFQLVPGLEKMVSTVGAFYKLLIPQVLPKTINKVVFLDPDTIVNLDIKELWKTRLGKTLLGVVPEANNGVNTEKAFLLCSEGTVAPEDYFNGGVLLMNLRFLRDETKTIIKGIRFRGENPKHRWLEQTVLNYCFSKNTVKLPVQFNCFVRKERAAAQPTVSEQIYHYSGGASRPRLNMNDPFNRLWMKYFIKTPWFDVDAFARLYAGLQKNLGTGQKNSSLDLARILPGKIRAFFVEEANLDKMKALFEIKDYEEVIVAKDEASIKQLLGAMESCKGSCVFFITTEKLAKKNFSPEQLIKAGFVEGKDFLKAWELLSDTQVSSFDSYSLIEKL